MKSAARRLTPRTWLVGSAGLIYLVVLAGVDLAVRAGLPNHLARGYLELLLAVLGMFAVASFGLPMPAASRSYWRLSQAALALFALSFGFAAGADLTGHAAMGFAAGLALLLALPPLVAAVAVYVIEHQRWQHGLAALLDLAILVVAVVAICAPPVVSPLLAAGGPRALALGVSWTAEGVLFVGALWAGAGWVRSRVQMDYTILVGLLAGAWLLASIRLGLLLAGRVSEPWWLVAAYGPGFLLATLAPDLGTTPPGQLDQAPGTWSAARSYISYGPAAALLLAALGLVLTGGGGPTGRWLTVGALVVSAMLMARQFLLLRDHRELLGQRSRQALHDPLTGLLNRRAFDQDLEQQIYRCDRDLGHFVLALLDLDGLKTINDRGGHRAGDAALAATAAALTRSGRREDRVFRIGGDEFAVLLPGADRATGARVLSQAAELLRQSAAGVHFSSGIASAPEDGDTAATLFGAADTQLYQYKGNREQPHVGSILAPSVLSGT